jgi:two-component system, chemotaxis family, CheB/CheR fusion protein
MASYQIQLFGTDVNERGIEKARAGIYGERIAQEVSPERLRRFFTKVDEGYRVSKGVRDLCVFAKQNLAEDPPFSRMNVVACRNLLIYLGPELQRKVMPILHYALKQNGFLFLGNAESVAGFPEFFVAVDKKYRIFVKKAVASKLRYNFSANRYPRELGFSGRPTERNESEMSSDRKHEADGIVLRAYAPPGVVIDENMEILQFRGAIGPYIDPAPGRASLNLLKIAKKEFVAELRTAVNQAKKTNTSAKRKSVEFRRNGQLRSVNVSVEPLGSAEENRQYLILFEHASPTGLSSGNSVGKLRSGGRTTNKESAQLRRKLAQAEGHLQSLVESKEASDEEYQSANEEILSANEELQSTNEELETSKEELQSANEELNTVNDELHNRNIELDRANSDLSNILTSASLPVVMVDRGLRIRRLTAASAKVLKILPSDIGRPVSDIRWDVDVPNLDELIAGVIETLAPKELDVQAKDGHWYTLQIRPYRTTDDKIDGAVIVLADINEAKQASERIEKAKFLMEETLATVREPLLVLKQNLGVIYANPSFMRTFHVPVEETVGKSVYQLGDGQWNIPKLRAMLEEVLSKDLPVVDFEVEHDFPNLGRKTMLLNARKTENGHNDEPTMLLAIEDITSRKHAEDDLHLSKRELESLSIRLLVSAENEKRQLARELHDAFGQKLALLNLHLAEIAPLIPAQPDVAAEKLVTVREQFGNVTRGIQDFARLLHPAILHEMGLAAALRLECKHCADQSGMIVNLSLENIPKDLPEEIGLCLYRVTQEALQNIWKHAESKKVDVTVKASDEAIELRVEDFGKGFDVESVKGRVGLGLISMQERVRLVGGSLVFKSQMAHGTVVEALIPLKKDTDEFTATSAGG